MIEMNIDIPNNQEADLYFNDGTLLYYCYILYNGLSGTLAKKFQSEQIETLYKEALEEIQKLDSITKTPDDGLEFLGQIENLSLQELQSINLVGLKILIFQCIDSKNLANQEQTFTLDHDSAVRGIDKHRFKNSVGKSYGESVWNYTKLKEYLKLIRLSNTTLKGAHHVTTDAVEERKKRAIHNSWVERRRQNRNKTRSKQ
jgi:hypothetical protein